MISLGRETPSGVTRLESLPALAYARTPLAASWFCDADTEKRYAEYYRKTDAQLDAQSLYRLQGAEVRGKGVITLGGKIVQENLEGAPLEKIRSEIRNENPPRKRITGPVLYVMRYGVKNYGHWLTDILPRIVWFHDSHPDVPVVVHRDTPRQIREALSLFGIDGDAVVELGDEHVLIDDMFFIDLWNQHPLVHSPRSFEYLRTLKERVLAKRSWRLRTRPRKLFVSRKDAGTRQLLNHEAVAHFLRGRGFTEIACGSLSMDEQIRQFAAADVVVGVSGAAMTNMCFCAPGTRVVNLSSSSMPSLYFWDVAHHCRLAYGIGYFPAQNPERGIHADFSVDLSGLENLLNG